jgi:hypothetical protein
MKTEIKTLVGKIKADYVKFATANGKKELTGWFAEEVNNFEKNTIITSGKKYIKIVRDNCVWGFVVKEDGPKFNKGDILKAAGFNSPATNRARGNIFDDSYTVRWTGPLYLK